MSEFRVGDIVEAFGVRGTVVRYPPEGGPYCVKVDFTGGGRDAFTEDGKAGTWHKEPSLKLISRVKKKKKITVWVGLGFKNIVSGRIFYESHAVENKDYIDDSLAINGVHPIEIEVDDE